MLLEHFLVLLSRSESSAHCIVRASPNPASPQEASEPMKYGARATSNSVVFPARNLVTATFTVLNNVC